LAGGPIGAALVRATPWSSDRQRHRLERPPADGRLPAAGLPAGVVNLVSGAAAKSATP